MLFKAFKRRLQKRGCYKNHAINEKHAYYKVVGVTNKGVKLMKKPRNLETAEQQLARIKKQVKDDKRRKLEEAVATGIPMNPPEDILK